ncbi:ATP-binding cassette-type vacuolar membrane transporter-like protein Hmt1 [Tothia fuscella]|uniref:ATP-binding cassette-type vacuolar membrane transporter-like protein Hmt1 n=1 Tax=Tothia fuscella TaxID=1048955 RepID=A0A9P4NF34_9PEZI|nr:ATP-binding cassette-type vacuolar membrane transporter-like protein Hmt1 [Tothia fuscella]
MIQATSAVIAGVNYLYPLTTATLFTIKSIFNWWIQPTAEKCRKEKNCQLQRKIGLCLLSVCILTYIFQAILHLYHAFAQKGWWAPQHEILGLLASIAVWGTICIRLQGSQQTTWSPYFLSFLVGLGFETAICILSLPAKTTSDLFDVLALSARGARIAGFVFLVATTISVAIKPEISESNDDEERQSLLGDNADANAQYGAVSSNDVNPEPEDRDKKIKELQQKRLEELGVLGYIKEFKIFLPCLWPGKNWKIQFCLLVMIIHLLVERCFNILVPRQVGIITDKLASGSPPWKAIALWILFKYLNGYACFGIIESVAEIHVRNFSKRKISALAFSHLMNLPMSFHHDKDSGEVLRSVDQGAALIDLLKVTMFEVSPVVLDVFISLFYITHLFDAYMASIVMLVGAIYVYISFKVTAINQIKRRAYSEKSREEYKTLYESISNWETVAYFNRVPHEEQRYNEIVDKSIGSYMTYFMASCWGYALQTLVLTIGLLSASFLAAYQITIGEKPVGSYVFLVMYWSTMIGPLARLNYSWKQITSTLVDAERLLQLMQTKPTVVERENAPDLHWPEGEVKFDDVDFSYDPRKQTLKGISFTAAPGQTLAFVGETGGGKSTTLKLLMRFYDVSSGSISIGGQDLRDVTLGSLREAIGTVPQDPSMFNQTIMENVRYAKLDATDDQVMEACRAAAVHNKIMGFPNKYKSKVGERGVKLSGGELQRIAIARIFLKNPSIVLLDEATSAVDSSIEAQIQSAFKKLSKGRTTFVVAHRLSTIVDADLIIVIDHGEIIERGTHNELIAHGGKYFELWTKQTAGKSSKASSITITDTPPADEDLLNDDKSLEAYNDNLKKNIATECAKMETQGKAQVLLEDEAQGVAADGEDAAVPEGPEQHGSVAKDDKTVL